MAVLSFTSPQPISNAGKRASLQRSVAQICAGPLHPLQGHSHSHKKTLGKHHNLTQTPRGRRSFRTATRGFGTPRDAPADNKPRDIDLFNRCFANSLFSPDSFPGQNPTPDPSSKSLPPWRRDALTAAPAHSAELRAALQSLHTVVQYLLSLQVTLEPIN